MVDELVEELVASCGRCTSTELGLWDCDFEPEERIISSPLMITLSSDTLVRSDRKSESVLVVESELLKPGTDSMMHRTSGEVKCNSNIGSVSELPLDILSEDDGSVKLKPVSDVGSELSQPRTDVLAETPSGVWDKLSVDLGPVDRLPPRSSKRVKMCDAASVGHKVKLPQDLCGQRETDLFCFRQEFEDEASILEVRGWNLVSDDDGVEEISHIGPAVVYRGFLGGVPITFLADSGAQVNLVSQRFCEDNLQFHVVSDHSVALRFGNDQESMTVGALYNTALSCQGRVSEVNRICVSPHDLGTVDLILGTPWLRQTGAGVFVDPVPRVVFPTGPDWLLHDPVGFDNKQADIKVVAGKQAQSFLRQHKGQLDVFALRLGGASPASVSSALKSASNQGVLADEFRALLQEFDDVLRDQLPSNSDRAGGEFLSESVLHIPLKEGTVPKKYRPIPLSHGEALVMQELLGEMIAKEFIEEANDSSGWSAPVFLLRKPGNREGTACNKFRLLCDLRGANACVVPETYFPADIATLMRQLSECSIFTSCDFLNGYQQMGIEEASRDITTFSVQLPGKGLCYFRYKTVCLGIQNAVGKFQTYAERVCRDLDKLGWGNVCVYIDDVLLASKAGEDNLRLARAFLERCRRYKVYLARSKCVWGVIRLDFLGFSISKDCVEISDKKKEALRAFEVPTSYAQTRRFVGFCVYLSQHVDHFSSRVAPLTTLLKGDQKGALRKKFIWSAGCQEAFEGIKEAILKASGLFIPNNVDQLSIECDASGCGVGAALYQTVDGILRPIWFASHKLSKAEANYPSRSLEMLAIIFALKKFRGYVALVHVHIYSDHESLAGFLKQPSLRGRDARWQELLSEFRFTQFYRKGELMLVADGLSRSQSELTAVGVMDFIEDESFPGVNKWHTCSSVRASRCGDDSDESSSSGFYRDGQRSQRTCEARFKG